MNQHRFLNVVVWLSFFLPAVCCGQTVSRSASLRVFESLAGTPTESTFFTNIYSAGSLRGVERTVSGSGSYGRASAVVDAFALRFSGKWNGQAKLFNGEGPTRSEGYAGISLSDSVRITSPSVPDGAHRQATARIRLLVSSTQSLSGPEGGAGTMVSISLHNFRTQFEFWGTNGLPNGEFFIDMPAYVDGPNPPYALNYLYLIATCAGGASGGLQPSGPPFSSSAGTSFTLTWGGIVSLKLDDGTIISDFQATGLSGAAYRSQRARTDLVPAIGATPNESTIRLQWAGTSDIHYQVESVTSLSDTQWLPLGGTVPGDGANVITENIQPLGSRFYRIVDAHMP